MDDAPQDMQEPLALGPAPAWDDTHCPACRDELVRINMLIDGEEIIMLSCSNCDRRSWHRAGEEIELGGVLHDLSSVPTRYRRNLAAR